MDMYLKGQTALVTGSTKELAKQLHLNLLKKVLMSLLMVEVQGRLMKLLRK